VLPLGNKRVFGGEELSPLTPTITYDGEEFLLLAPQIASMPSKLLNDPVGSLTHFRAEIIAALDFAITGA